MNSVDQQAMKQHSIRAQGSFRNAQRSVNLFALRSYIAWGMQEVQHMINIIVQL